MSAFTITADNWTQTAKINELVTAVSERRQAVGLSALVPIPDNTDLQSYSIWATLQSALEECVPYYIAADESILTLTSWRIASGLPYGYRRMDATGAASFGTHEAYDVIGTWLFDDIELGASALKYIAFSRASVERVRKWKPAIDLAITAPTYLSNPARANSTMWFNMDKTTSKDALEILDDGDQYSSGFEDYTSLGRYVNGFPYLTDERTFYWFNDTKLFSGPQAASLSCNELIFIAAEEDPYIFGKSNVTDIAITRADKLVQSSFNATVGGEGFVTFNVKIALAPEFSNTRESVQ